MTVNMTTKDVSGYMCLVFILFFWDVLWVYINFMVEVLTCHERSIYYMGYYVT